MGSIFAIKLGGAKPKREEKSERYDPTEADDGSEADFSATDELHKEHAGDLIAALKNGDRDEVVKAIRAIAGCDE